MIKNNILLADIPYSFSTNGIIRNNIVGATTFALMALLKIALVTKYFYSSDHQELRIIGAPTLHLMMSSLVQQILL
jgi:hypothetical protein